MSEITTGAWRLAPMQVMKYENIDDIKALDLKIIELLKNR